MTHTRQLLSRLAISGLLLALAPTSAFAVDTAEVESRLKAFLQGQGIEASWSALDGDASRMSLTGLTVTAPGQSESLPLGDLEMTDLSEDGDVIVVGTLSMPAYAVADEGVDVKITGISLSGLRLPPVDNADPIDAMGFYDRAVVEAMSVSIGGKPIFSLGDVDASMNRDDGVVTFTGGAAHFSVDLEALDAQEAKATTQALGYDTISGSYQISGSWSPADGRVILDRNDFAIDNAGTLGITIDLSGYTPEFTKTVRDLQAKMAQASEEEQAVQAMQMLGLMQQINLHGAKVLFEDRSLTQKVLAFVAAQQGAKPADIANQAKAVLPFALAQLNNPQFTVEVTGAVSAFLDDPRSLEISIEPENPIPFALVAAGAMTAPQALPQQLGMRVRANR